jgi:hypothetical protein
MSHKAIQCYDPFVADSIVMHYWVPGATVADKAAAIQELMRRGQHEEDIAAWLAVTVRTVARLKAMEVIPLLPIPAWAEQDYPQCVNGHEMSPDNTYTRNDRRSDWRGCQTCRHQKANSARHLRKVATVS